MAYKEPLISTRSLEMFAPPGVLSRIRQALDEGRAVEMEHTSFSDPGPDESRVLIEGKRIFTVPGY